MTRRSYRVALRDARNDLQELFRQRERLERRIVQARQSVIALQRMIEGVKPVQDLLNEFPDKGVGLTSAIRYILMGATQPLSPVNVRNHLESVGYDIGSSPNVMNNVHTVLSRLVDQKEVKRLGRRATSRTAKKEGYHFTTIGYWWGEYGIPKGWTIYPTKRMLKEWGDAEKNRSTKEDSAAN